MTNRKKIIMLMTAFMLAWFAYDSLDHHIGCKCRAKCLGPTLLLPEHVEINSDGLSITISPTNQIIKKEPKPSLNWYISCAAAAAAAAHLLPPKKELCGSKTGDIYG